MLLCEVPYPGTESSMITSIHHAGTVTDVAAARDPAAVYIVTCNATRYRQTAACGDVNSSTGGGQRAKRQSEKVRRVAKRACSLAKEQE